MARYQQRKGKRGEDELAELLRLNGFLHVHANGSETFGTLPDVSGLPQIHIEVKRVERLNIHAALEQSARDALRFRDGYPCVFHRRNKDQDWTVTMPFRAWMMLYKAFLRDKEHREKLLRRS